MYCRTYETYINKLNVEMESKPSSIKRLLSLKINKGSGVDDFSFNIIEKCFGMLCELLIYLFQLSLVKGLFPDDLKIAKVTLIYKTGIQVSNCRPISVLPCFSKILERLMYNRLYKYFFSIWVLFHKHSQITGLQGKEEGIPLTHYHFHPLHRHLDISRAITAESSPLHIASSQIRTGNLWFLSARN